VAAALPEAAVFDNDGLLLDTESLWTRAEETLFERRGRTFTLEHKLHLVGSSEAVAGPLLAEMLDEPGRATEIMVELHELVMGEAEAGGEPMAGARELIDALAAAGVPIALVSNSPAAFVEAVIAPTGLRDAFELLLSPGDGLASKPAPDLYLEACLRLGAAPERSVALEDSVPGVAAGKAARMTVVGIPSVPGVELDSADILAESLSAPEVWQALGISNE
jgi:HAD superfamily hydrolase (TIGR01509 family)